MKCEKLHHIYITIDRASADDRKDGFVEAYLRKDKVKIIGCIASDLVRTVQEGRLDVAFPSLNVPPLIEERTYGKGVEPGEAAIEGLSRLILSFSSGDKDILKRLMEEYSNLSGFEGEGADPAFDTVDHWCPGQPPNHKFGDRAAAHRLIKHRKLVKKKLFGKDVRAVIVDQGLNRDHVRTRLNGRFGGGWAFCPGGQPPCILPGGLRVLRGVTDNDHGMMIARNLLAVAPKVHLYDLPLLPARITDIARFLSDAHAAFQRILDDLRRRRSKEKDERWVLVNAWAIFDRMGEYPPGYYTTNPCHPFNRLIEEIVNENVDVVFAAGNSGQFCPDLRAGPYDVGPGNSVFGANAHRRVLSVGAARTDAIWVGSSSQGPGALDCKAWKCDPQLCDHEKPDLVAPSMFTEVRDRHTVNGGTSAACGLAAGVVAAIRQDWGPSALSPDDLRQHLRNKAWRVGPDRWDGRLGYGVIQAKPPA